jgi:hypothetical protein
VDLLCIDEDDCTSDSCTAVGCQHIALEDCPPDTTDPEPLPESEWDPELQSTPDLLSEQDVEVVTGEDLEYSPDVGDLHTSSELNSDADVMPHEDSPPPASGCSATPPHDPTTILLLFVALLQIVSLLRVRRPT